MADQIKFDFLKYRSIAFVLSALLLAVSIYALATNGLKFGIDFTGGTLVELEYKEAPNLDEIRATLAASEFGDSIVQEFGSPLDILVRLAATEDLADAAVSNEVLKLLPGAEMRRVEFVGPQVGEELTEDGGLALLTALIVVMLYILVRFTKQFSIGAVVALAHDVFIVLGFFAIFQWTFDLTVLAALLADLEESIDQVTVIERQIGPLVERMITNLETFVELDIPFLIQERRDRIDFLKDTLDRADVSVAEKFSQVLQAY